MEKEIIQVDKKAGIYRITTLNERFYARPGIKQMNGLPTYDFFPSTTWIASYYYTSPYLIKYIADKGWDESQRLMNAAGDRGTKVHYACTDIDLGQQIDVVNGKYLNKTSGLLENLSIEEINCIDSYIRFLEKYQPIVLANELTCFSDISAGTIDKIFAVPNKLDPKQRQIWILDLKTSKQVWDEHKLQISDYSHMDIDYQKMGITPSEWANRKLMILQLGYKDNKDGYKLTEVADMYDLFRNVAYRIWKQQNPNARPTEAEYPLFLKSQFRIKQLTLDGKLQEEKVGEQSNFEKKINVTTK